MPKTKEIILYLACVKLCLARCGIKILIQQRATVSLAQCDVMGYYPAEK